MVKFDPLDNYYPEIIASPHTAPVRTDGEIAEDEVSSLKVRIVTIVLT